MAGDNRIFFRKSLRGEKPRNGGANLFLYRAELLHVNRFHHFFAVGDRGFLESLTGAELFDDTGAFVFAFEFL